LKKYLLSLTVIAAVAVATLLWLRRETSLVDLQKEYLFAESDEEREKVIDRLEDYYLNLSVPDSIRQQVDDEVASLLETTEIDPAAYTQDKWDTNVYKLENRLRGLIKTAMIARARDDEALFRKLMHVATEMAANVDKGTGADYWVAFVDEKSEVTNEGAIAWLKAERAARLCYEDYFSERWRQAELYGSIGLKHIAETKNSRLKLDILQRLQFMLYGYRGLYELSVGLAGESLKKANEVNYILRSQAIAHYQADALFENGRIVEALDNFQKLKNSAESHSQVPSMKWYFNKSLFRIANCYWRTGQLHEALALLKKIEGYKLDSSDKIWLHSSRGLINRRLGNYVMAELEYRIALAIADSINDGSNQIRILNNFGFMYSELTEYNEALKYYKQVQTLLDKFFPEDAEYRINLFINIARVKEKQGETKIVAGLINDSDKLLRKLGALPIRNADMLITIGTLSSEIGKNQEAIKKFHEADVLCDEHGLTRLGLEGKLKLAEIMIRLKRYSDARDKINETLHIAKQYDDSERVIDLLALLAELEYQEGNLEKAVETSNRLIAEIENIIHSGFEGSRRLISYHQKIYDYLKKAVTYEIQLERLDYAFTKLDYAKSLSSRYHTVKGNGIHHTDKVNRGPAYVDLRKSQIGEQSLLINFMLTSDELYLFTLDRDRLHLFRKKIDFESLGKTISAYLDALNKTVEIFDRYDVDTIDAHFYNTTQLAHKLFQELMGWPDLLANLQKVEVIYIIPDEFLYKIPFSTLVLKDSEPVSYLVQNVAVVNLQSASALESKNVWLEKSDTKNLNVLISADPNFQEMKKFVSDINKLIPSAQIIAIDEDKVEKKDIIEKLSENFDVYVFSGHSVANPIEPELSYIEVFAKSSLGANSQTFKIKLADLRALKWSSPKLVLLVGCETAGGKLYRGSGFLGLQNLLLSQGAQNVLASLWKIDAAQAIPQTKDYLHLYLQNFNPALALRKTQIKAINDLNNHSYYRKPHPYFWGAYTLYSMSN